jgi:hypothetical protein
LSSDRPRLRRASLSPEAQEPDLIYCLIHFFSRIAPVRTLYPPTGLPLMIRELTIPIFREMFPEGADRLQRIIFPSD